MKKIFWLFLLWALLVNNSFGAPLILKVTKEIKSGLVSELATVDASKYKQLRILVKRDFNKTIAERSDFYFINTYLVDGDEEILITESAELLTRYSTLIDTPPSALRIKVTGQGKFTLYVWAQ